MKRPVAPNSSRAFSLPATCGFLLLALGLVVGCVMIVFGMLEKRDAPLPDTAAVPEASPEPVTAESSEAAALHIPVEGRLPTPEPPPDDHPATPAPSPTPSVSPTPMPPVSAPALSKERMDFAVLGFDAEDRADALLIVQLDENGCTVLSLPRNTLALGGGTLGDAGSASQALRAMRSVFPVYLGGHVTLDMRGLADCVDALGGVVLDGELKNGAEAAAYLEAGGSDELLRIMRQQSFFGALASRLKQLGLLRLLSTKHTIQKYADGNLSGSQYLELYGMLRRLDTENIRFLCLPVDSVIREGRRYYAADRPLCEALVRELYPAAD